MTLNDAARKARLRDYLDQSRTAALWKTENLSESGLRLPLVPSGSSILGIINHLAFTEFGYFSYCLKRPVTNQRALDLFKLDDPLGDFVVEKEVSSAEVREFYQQAISASNAGIDELELTAPAFVPWWGEHAATTLEHLLIHMCSETARHAGHLDLLRELLDGSIGFTRGNTNLPDLSPTEWKEHYERLKGIAEAL